MWGGGAVGRWNSTRNEREDMWGTGVVGVVGRTGQGFTCHTHGLAPKQHNG